MPAPEDPSSTAVFPGSRIAAQLVEPAPVDDRQDDDRHADRDRLHLGDRRVDVLRDVRLGQQDHRLCPARPREREVTLEPAQVQVAGHRRDEEREVGVRRDDLLGLTAVRRRAPHERGMPREDAVDHAGPVWLERDADPVAGDRERSLRRVADEPPRERCGHLALVGDEREDPALLHAHAPRCEAAVGEFLARRAPGAQGSSRS